MHLIYIDDSGDETCCIFSALAVPADLWRECLGLLRGHRRELKASDGVYVGKELHAWKFVSGRGDIADRIVSKGRRAVIFRETLQLAASLPGVRLFNAAFGAGQDERAFERLLNRLNKSMEMSNSHAVLFCDEGKETQYTRLVRRMGVYNPIPSRFGAWSSGQPTRNITIDRIIEDPVFKDSKRSYFSQLVDFCAYALLRREHPLESKSRYGLATMFEALQPILATEATRKDPEGTLRP